MSGKCPAEGPDDLRVTKVVRLLSNQALQINLSLPKATRAEGFTEADAKDRVKQIWIGPRLPQ